MTFPGLISCRTGLLLNSNVFEYLVGGRWLALKGKNKGISIFQSYAENRSRTLPDGFLDYFFSSKLVNCDRL